MESSDETIYCSKCKKFSKNIYEEFSKDHQKFIVKLPQLLILMYDLKSELGSGSFGVVFKALQRSDSKPFAVKMLSLEGLSGESLEDELKDLMNEIHVCCTIKHEYIINYLNSFIFNSNTVAIVMELADTSIDQLIGQLSAKQCNDFMLQICYAVDYLHNKKNIIHRDLKPQNILIKDRKVKICDFGIAKFQHHDKTKTRAIGTKNYMAPELLLEEELLDQKIDIWAIGIIFHQMMTDGKHPFGEKAKINGNMINGKFTIDDKIQDQKIKEMLQGCFKIDPEERIDITAIIKTLEKNKNIPTNETMKENKQVEKKNTFKEVVEETKHESNSPSKDLSFKKSKELKEKPIIKMEQVNKSGDLERLDFKNTTGITIKYDFDWEEQSYDDYIEKINEITSLSNFKNVRKLEIEILDMTFEDKSILQIFSRALGKMDLLESLDLRLNNRIW